MTKITDNTTLKAYIERQLKPCRSIIDKAQARANINLQISKITSLSPETIAKATRANPQILAARNYSLIQAAINDGRLPS